MLMGEWNRDFHAQKSNLATLTLMECIGVASNGEPVSLNIVCLSLILIEPFTVLIVILSR